MINSKNRNQMEQLALAMQGLTLSQGMYFLFCGLGVKDPGVRIIFRGANSDENNDIVFSIASELNEKGTGIESVYAHFKIHLTEDEIKKKSKELKTDAKSLPNVIANYLMFYLTIGELDPFIRSFQNVESSFSILTDEYIQYPIGAWSKGNEQIATHTNE